MPCASKIDDVKWIVNPGRANAESAGDVYLDIETSYYGDITVVGFYSQSCGLVQLVRPRISRARLQRVLPPAQRLLTFNGHSFDLPIIRRQLELDLRGRFESVDLRYACKRAGLTGGQKAIERMLGLERELPGLSGWDALRLWEAYWNDEDAAALETLLCYNREDVMNMVKIHAVLRDLRILG